MEQLKGLPKLFLQLYLVSSTNGIRCVGMWNMESKLRSQTRVLVMKGGKGCERSIMVGILKIQIENKLNPDYAM